MHFDLAENNVESVTRRAATFIRYWCPLGHNFAHSAHLPSKLGIQSAYMSGYIDKNYSMRKTFICGAMKPVSVPFDQPTYVVDVYKMILIHIHNIRCYGELMMIKVTTLVFCENFMSTETFT